jgi:hypothetical protein
MHALSASDLLEIWERGAGGNPVEQALAILGAAFPQASMGKLAGLSVAQRDAALFGLHEQTFGPQLKGLVACPACGEQLELGFDTHELRAAGILPADLVPGAETIEPDGAETSLRIKGYQVVFRLPTSADLEEVVSLPDQALARRQLLEACLVSVRRKDRDVPAHELPTDILGAIVAGMEAAAPLANLTVACACPACEHTWEVVLDIVSYFWSEISAWAVRMLHEVHSLASSYGWREADILAMSAWRRQRYLELIGIG